MDNPVKDYFYSWKQKLEYLGTKDYDMCILLSQN